MSEKKSQNPYEDINEHERGLTSGEAPPQYSADHGAPRAPPQAGYVSPHGAPAQSPPVPQQGGGYLPQGAPDGQAPPQGYYYPPQGGAPQHQYGPPPGAQGGYYPPQAGPGGYYPPQGEAQQFAPPPQAGPGGYYPPQEGAPGFAPQEPITAPEPIIPSGDRPVAIPQIASDREAPFLRAYPPVLLEHRIPKEMFLRFMDKLNEAMLHSPPMQVLDVTGGMLQSVPILFPLHWIGNAISKSADAGNNHMSKSRADGVVKQANKDMFNPLGLKAEIAKLLPIAKLYEIPVLNSAGTEVDNYSHLIKEMVDLDIESPEPEDQLDFQKRRMALFKPWFTELEIEADLPTKKSGLGRFNKSVKNYYQGRKGKGPIEHDPHKPDPEIYKAFWLLIRKLEQ